MLTLDDLPKGWVISTDPMQPWVVVRLKDGSSNTIAKATIAWGGPGTSRGIYRQEKNPPFTVDYFKFEKCAGGGIWTILIGEEENFDYEEAVHYLVTMIRLGEIERLCNG